MAPSLALLARAVEIDHRRVDLGLVLGLKAEDGIGDRAVDRADRLANPLAAPARLVAVALLDRFMRTGRGARGNRGAAHRSVFQRDVDLDRRIAPAVEDLPGMDVDDRGHVVPFFDELAREFVAAPIRRGAKGATYGSVAGTRVGVPG